MKHWHRVDIDKKLWNFSVRVKLLKSLFKSQNRAPFTTKKHIKTKTVLVRENKIFRVLKNGDDEVRGRLGKRGYKMTEPKNEQK